MRKTIHAVRFVSINASQLNFCASPQEAKALAFRLSLKNPQCVRAAKYFAAEPKVVRFAPDTPLLSESWTSAYDGGGNDAAVEGVTVVEVLAQFARRRLRLVRKIRQLVADRDRNAVLTAVTSKKWHGRVECATLAPRQSSPRSDSPVRLVRLVGRRSGTGPLDGLVLFPKNPESLRRTAPPPFFLRKI